MLASRLTTKGQATIPVSVRQALNLKPGDMVAFEIVDHKAVISKVESFDFEYHHALSTTLTEWNSQADIEDYKDL